MCCHEIYEAQLTPAGRIAELEMKRKTIIEDLEGRLEAVREFGFNPNDSIDDVKGKDAAYALGRRDEIEYALKLLREED